MYRVIYFITSLTDSSLVPVYKGTGVPVYADLEAGGSISLVSAGLRSFAALALVLALMFLFVWAFRKFRKGTVFGWKDGPIKVLGRSALNSKQSIYLVEVPDHLLVLGVSGENINVLSEIRDRSTIEAVKSRHIGFSHHLSRSMSRFIRHPAFAGRDAEIRNSNPVQGKPIELGAEFKPKVVGKRNSGLWEHSNAKC